jgi:hypothetical protein
MSQPEDVIVQAARAIRPFLPELIPDDAARFDQLLLVLLTKNDAGQDIVTDVQDLLATKDATRDWLIEFVSEQQAPPVQRGFHALLGQTEVGTKASHRCQNCGYEWAPQQVGELPPGNCPNCGRQDEWRALDGTGGPH